MALFDAEKERLAVGAIIMASILFITAFACLWLIERRDASERQHEREQLGSLVRESLGTMDSTLQELVIQTRTQERIIDRQQEKEAFLDSAYREVRYLNEMLEDKHYRTLRQLKSTRNQLNDNVRSQKTFVPQLQRSVLDSLPE